MAGRACSVERTRVGCRRWDFRELLGRPLDFFFSLLTAFQIWRGGSVREGAGTQKESYRTRKFRRVSQPREGEIIRRLGYSDEMNGKLSLQRHQGRRRGRKERIEAESQLLVMKNEGKERKKN
jgi:hypothetical protein